MSGGGEMVTLQLGHYANFTGAHLWNLHDAYGNGEALHELSLQPLYRITEVKGEATYVPRALVYDLKGSLGGLRLDGLAFQEPVKVDAPKDTMVFSQPQYQPNEFHRAMDEEKRRRLLEASDSKDQLDEELKAKEEEQQAKKAKKEEKKEEEEDKPADDFRLNDKVTLWSDYLRSYYHHRSVVELPTEYATKENPSQHFSNYCQGVDAMASTTMMDTVEDQVRYFAEECNRLDSYTMLYDGHDGFGGFAAGMATYLKDEFRKVSLLSVPLTAHVPPLSDPFMLDQITSNLGFSLSAMKNYADVILPINTLDASYSCQLDPLKKHIFHTSALAAAAVDSLTIPARNGFRMSNLAALLVPQPSTPIAIVAHALGLPVNCLQPPAVSLPPLLKNGLWNSPIMAPLLRGVEEPEESSVFASYTACRGIDTLINNFHVSETKKRKEAAVERNLNTDLKSTREAFEKSVVMPKDKRAVIHWETQPLHTPRSFPLLFTPSTSREGTLSVPQKDGLPREVKTAPTVVQAVNTSGVMPVLKGLASAFNHLPRTSRSQILNANVNEDDFNEACGSLTNLASAYEVFDWGMSSDDEE